MLRVRFLSRTDEGEERWEGACRALGEGKYAFEHAGARYHVSAGERLVVRCAGELNYLLELDAARETALTIATPYGELSAGVRTENLTVQSGQDGHTVFAEYLVDIGGEGQRRLLTIEFTQGGEA